MADSPCRTNQRPPTTLGRVEPGYLTAKERGRQPSGRSGWSDGSRPGRATVVHPLADVAPRHSYFVDDVRRHLKDQYGEQVHAGGLEKFRCRWLEAATSMPTMQQRTSTVARPLKPCDVPEAGMPVLARSRSLVQLVVSSADDRTQGGPRP